MTAVEHRLLWSRLYEQEHNLVLAEAERVAANGGGFKIVNEYRDNWYSVITIYYPEGGEK